MVVTGPGSADELAAAEEMMIADSAAVVLDGRQLVAVARASDAGDAAVELSWFDLEASNCDDFVELSTEARPAFDASVFGVFHSLDQAGFGAQVLVTR